MHHMSGEDFPLIDRQNMDEQELRKQFDEARKERNDLRCQLAEQEAQLVEILETLKLMQAQIFDAFGQRAAAQDQVERMQDARESLLDNRETELNQRERFLKEREKQSYVNGKYDEKGL